MKRGSMSIKRTLSFILAFVMVLSMFPAVALAADTKTIYLKPGEWNQSSAWFQAWVWGSTQADAWYTFTDDNKDGIFQTQVPSDATGMKLLRKSPDHSADNWDKWNETDDLTIEGNCFTITGWSYGEWSTLAYYIAGSIGESGWDPTKGEKMTDADDDGIFTYTYTDVAAGDYKFKVTDGTWNNCWGGTADADGNYGFSVAESDSTVKIAFSLDSKEITVDVTAPAPEVYTVTFNGTNVTSDGGDTATAGSDYTANLAATTGYTLPATVTVTVGDAAISDYTYENGTLTIPAGSVTGNIVITAEGVEEETEPVAVAYLAGTMNGWSDSATPIYAETGATVSLDAGTYEFKIVCDGAWYGNYGTIVDTTTTTSDIGWEMVNGANNCVLTATGGKYTFIFDAETKMLVVKHTPAEGGKTEEPEPEVTEPDEETVTVYFRNDWYWPEVYVHYWNLDDESQTTTWPGVEMTFVENITVEGNELGVYTAEIPVWANALKFNGEKANDNTQWEETPAVTGFADGSAYYIHWDGENKCSGFTYPVVPGEPDTEVSYYVAGSSGLCGVDWDAGNAANKMALNADGLYEKTYENVAAGPYEFKVTDGTWDKSWPGNNYVLNVAAASNVTITFNPTSGEIGVTQEVVEGAETPEAAYYIAGTQALCGAEWDAGNASNKMTLNEETGLYEITFKSVPIGKHSFKVTDGTWNNCWGGSGTDGNYEMTLTAISNVTISFDASTQAISVAVAPTGEVPEPVEYVTIHFRNTGSWNTVKAYSWDLATGDLFTAAWSGDTLTADTSATNWYTLTLNDLTAYSGVGVVFNDGGNNQTADIAIAKSGEYWYDGTLLSEAPATWPNGEVETVDYEVTLHLANTLNWSNADLYTWTESGANPTGGWPGTAAGLDSNGFYTLTFTYEAPAGQGLNFIFSGSGQTVDLKLDSTAFDSEYKTERWVVPGTQNDGKYEAQILDNPNSIAVSPIVDGTSVTFQYKGNTGDTVVLHGSMNDWKEGYEMTNNGHGVYSVTVDNVPYGIGQYKFQVNGADEWITDPLNNWTVTDDDNNKNSAFLVSDPSLDENEVNIVVHYTPADSYWNLCAWGATGLKDQYDFVDNKTTITLDGRANQYVAFKIRKSIEGNDWAEQSGEIKVNLGDIVSGTIDVYVDSSFNVTQRLNADVVTANKITSVELDYDNNLITIYTAKMVEEALTAFDLVNIKDDADTIAITSFTTRGSSYSLTLNKTLDLVNLWKYKIRFLEQEKYTDHNYTIGINTVYASAKFADEFTYDGDDLGGVVDGEKNETRFVLWAPTAEAVSVNLYTSGGEAENDSICDPLPMEKDEKGVWRLTLDTYYAEAYYTYSVTRDGETVEAVDPYARTTGVNGKRGQLINLDDTDPVDGWSEISKPASYTDAVIYELHVRDFSIDDSSGVKDEWQGKFLALTQTGTTTDKGTSTGLDYLKELGVTHLHLLPIYDYASVDETTCSTFNWGYDPQNYNVPEGSYSTNPYNGYNRVQELKETVDTLHENNIGVIMDVVYNHVYDAGTFCFNQIVPGYFSRPNSNTSGCGNDTASEREMVRKYIVESVVYWAEEYHLDGFRFDLVGLLDVDTINQIVTEVHKIRPDIIFYGEGWDMDSTNKEPGTEMAKQGNADLTQGFGYFSDNMRNALAGNNGNSLGFVSGDFSQTGTIAANFLGNPWWTSNPSQVIQYASCHDNYTLIDKMVVSSGKANVYFSAADLIKMNNLAAAIYMTAQGIPFIHAGEEFLREKLEEDGETRCENSYNASDDVNKIRWSNLDGEFYDSEVSYADNVEYYKGLIEFRKTHAALRLDTAEKVAKHVTRWDNDGDDGVIAYQITGGEATGDISDSIMVIFNATQASASVSLPSGTWNVCIDGENAGTKSLYTKSGSVSVDAVSAMVLVQDNDGHLSHTESEPIIEKETKATCTTDGYHETVIKCTVCDAELSRTYSVDAATGHKAGEKVQEDSTYIDCVTDYTYHDVVRCLNCNEVLSSEMVEVTAAGHQYENGICTVCGDYQTELYGTVMDPTSSLALGFQFLAENVPSVDYVALTHFYANGTTEVVTVKKDACALKDGLYTVYYSNIAAKEMKDTITIDFYAADGTILNEKGLYGSNVALHTDGVLNSDASDAVKTLYVDMLNYGAAAQEYFGYNTDDLANAFLTEEQKEYATDTVTAKDGRWKEDEVGAYAGTTLALDNEIRLNLVFNNSKVTKSMKAVFTYEDSNGVTQTVEVQGAQFTKYSNTRWRVTITVPVVYAANLVTCKIMDGDTTVVTVADSLESYMARVASSSGKPLFTEVLKYARSAKTAANLSVTE